VRFGGESRGGSNRQPLLILSLARRVWILSGYGVLYGAWGLASCSFAVFTFEISTGYMHSACAVIIQWLYPARALAFRTLSRIFVVFAHGVILPAPSIGAARGSPPFPRCTHYTGLRRGSFAQGGALPRTKSPDFALVRFAPCFFLGSKGRARFTACEGRNGGTTIDSYSASGAVSPLVPSLILVWHGPPFSGGYFDTAGLPRVRCRATTEHVFMAHGGRIAPRAAYAR